MEDEAFQTSTRRRFLRRLGTTLAVGLGVVAVPGRALAGSNTSAGPDFVAYVCCPDNGTHCVQNCGTGKNNYYCSNPNCAISFCYGCTKNTGMCFDDVLPGCLGPPPSPSGVGAETARRTAVMARR